MLLIGELAALAGNDVAGENSDAAVVASAELAAAIAKLSRRTA